MWIQNTKNSKEPLQKGNPEYWNLNGQAFYSTNILETAINHANFYHKYFATYVNKQLKEPFPHHGLHLEHGRGLFTMFTQRLRPILPTCGFSSND
jgi:hypothetical protein